MDCVQQKTHDPYATVESRCQLKLVNYEAPENHISHETEGLSRKHLVVRRGEPFKITLMFGDRPWNPHIESLVLEVWLGDVSENIRVQFSDEWSDPLRWSAKIYRSDMHPQSVTVHICSPVLSAVALYKLLLHIETRRTRRSYLVGTFVLLCNPWLKDDPVYMPLGVQTQEYIKSDYGMLYMGTPLNISSQPWSFGQYEPGVLEACLQLLQVSPQHLRDKNEDYALRADPVYLSRTLCAMVNCNDDLGILMGKWQGSYKDGVKPTEWSSSADILHQWFTSSCKPVRYGQCWVFASVLCTVMRVLGIPSRVVTVFNAAHDGDGSLSVEEYYTSTGEKLNLSKDSVWNFHVWVECWMRRPDLGSGFDGWQVVDPTPQEKSAGIYCCGPCPVVAIQQRYLGAFYDTGFISASVDADIIRLIVNDGLVVGRTVDTEAVGQLIYTKSIGSDRPENLTAVYKSKKRVQPTRAVRCTPRSERQTDTVMMNMCSVAVGGPMQSSQLQDGAVAYCSSMQSSQLQDGAVAYCSSMQSSQLQDGAGFPEGLSQGLEVSLNIDGVPSVGNSIVMCVTLTNQSSSPRVVMEHLNAQVKEFNGSPQESFWKTHKKIHIKAGEVLKLKHTIPTSEYEAYLAGDDIVNVAVVIKDLKTNESILAAQEFNISSPQIAIEIDGGDTIKLKDEHTAQVSFINTFPKTLNGAVLTVEGSGLLKGKHQASLVFLKPGEKIEKQVSIVASSPGTKVLMATFSHSNSPGVVSRNFHRVSVMTD
ncbi:protein-glutamine gamma-glutamyltransferase 5-like isoform X2 [Labrus mixtus]|uniref:protein-glutamine gamma-glutamyltransferase 5-like isoform X2 n=1 Tax=Labrus mixtus TaxID=508554 RepID=UPI0029C0F2A7|nr:protein-glutamine gamma-glutamyltransferase 5-like isoform X2 [Labrus mixtus]